jgi:hypothetical protein
MEFYKVRNEVGTSDNTPPTEYGSWIEYWEGSSNERAKICYRKGCSNAQDLVGAHVRLVDSPQKLYIVPLCKSCNNSDDVLDVSAPLVSVNSGNVIRGSFFDNLQPMEY